MAALAGAAVLLMQNKKKARVNRRKYTAQGRLRTSLRMVLILIP